MGFTKGYWEPSPLSFPNKTCILHIFHVSLKNTTKFATLDGLRYSQDRNQRESVCGQKRHCLNIVVTLNQNNILSRISSIFKIKTQAAIIEFLSHIRFIIQTHHLKQELWDHFCRQLHSRLARQRREHLPCYHQLET